MARWATWLACAGACMLLSACSAAQGMPVEKMAKVQSVENGTVKLAIGASIVVPESEQTAVDTARWKRIWPQDQSTQTLKLYRQFAESGEELAVKLSDVKIFAQQEQSSLQIEEESLHVGDVLLLEFECDGTLSTVLRLQWPEEQLQ